MVKLRGRGIFANLKENQSTNAQPLRDGRYGSGAWSKISRLRSAKAGREPGIILPLIGRDSLVC
jgi:hypothetical protein